jgi:hypothetical protein
MIRGLLIALAVGIAVWLLAILILVIVGRKQQARELATAIPNLLILFRGLLRDPAGPSRLEDLARARGDLDRLSHRPRAGVSSPCSAPRTM